MIATILAGLKIFAAGIILALGFQFGKLLWDLARASGALMNDPLGNY